MQGLILAAGMGKRLKELTQDNTKCMVQVNGVPLIDRVLGQLSRLGLKRTVLVTGYEGAKLRKHVGRRWNGMKIDYVDNPIFDRTNNIYSLSLAADELIKDDTLLIESDLIFDDSVFDKVLNDPHHNVAVVDKFQSWMDGTCVTIDDDNLITRFVPKKDFIYEEIPSYYKTVNIYKFSKSFSRNDYVPFLKAYSKALGDNEYYEQVLRVISMLDKPLIHALPLSGDKWYEIDDKQDLDIAETIFSSPENQIEKLSSRFGGYWRFPGLKDFCYLVTPYFPGKRLRDELKSNFDILLEQYPSGQRVNAMLAAKLFGLGAEQVAVGNGAAEIIQAYMSVIGGKIGFVYPTFEEYPNRIDENRRVVFTPSCKNGFRYGVTDLISYFTDHPVANLIIINPDNPSGNYIPFAELNKLCTWCKRNGVRLLIDESFIDFSDRPYTLLIKSFLAKHPHLSVVKSISKSYGVPGLRLGVLASASVGLVDLIKQNLSIWNINSFGEFFLQIIEKHNKEYRRCCSELARERCRFSRQLSRIPFLRVFPSDANFILCRVCGSFTPRTLALRLWTTYKILIKDCSCKKGFAGSPFVRIAVRNAEDNNLMISALQALIKR